MNVIEKCKVSRETVDRLKTYQQLVLEWNHRFNLISKQSETVIWERHILDSLQLCEYIKAQDKILLDLKILEEPYNWKGSAFWSRIIVILIIFWQYFGYYTIIFTAGIKGISSELLEAASIDGASGKKIFFKIVLPLLRPIIVFACVTSIIGGLQIFDIPYTFGGVEGNPGKALFTMSMFMFRTTFKNNNFGYGAAISQGIFIIIVVFSFAFMKVITGRGERNYD